MQTKLANCPFKYGHMRLFLLFGFDLFPFSFFLSVMIIILTHSLCLVGWCGSFGECWVFVWL